MVTAGDCGERAKDLYLTLGSRLQAPGWAGLRESGCRERRYEQKSPQAQSSEEAERTAGIGVGPGEGSPRGWQEDQGVRKPKLLPERAAAIHQQLLGTQQELEPRVAQSSDLS